MKSQVITCSTDIMSGIPVFAGTRVPVSVFLDYMKGGESIEDFLQGFPSVKKAQLLTFLEEIEQDITPKAA